MELYPVMSSVRFFCYTQLKYTIRIHLTEVGGSFLNGDFDIIRRNLLNYFLKKVTKKRQLNTDGIFMLSNFPSEYVFLIAKYLFEPINVYDVDKFFLWPMVKSLIGQLYRIIGIRL